MLKKIAEHGLLLAYLFTLTFGIFLNQYVRFPSPFIFGLPLVFLFKADKGLSFIYKKETWVLFFAAFCFFIWGEADLKGFFVNASTLIIAILFFNYYIGNNYSRLKWTLIYMGGFLFISGLILIWNHMNPAVDQVREM